MNKKYLFAILLLSGIFIALFLIVNVQDQHGVYESKEFQAMIDKYNSDMQYIENNTGGVSSREIRQAYSNANGDVEQAIMMLNCLSNRSNMTNMNC